MYINKAICGHFVVISVCLYRSSIFSLFPKPVQHASNFRFAELRISIFDEFLITLIAFAWSLLLYLNIVEVWKFMLEWFQFILLRNAPKLAVTIPIMKRPEQRQLKVSGTIGSGINRMYCQPQYDGKCATLHLCKKKLECFEREGLLRQLQDIKRDLDQDFISFFSFFFCMRYVCAFFKYLYTNNVKD